jgi:hypothetical protein
MISKSLCLYVYVLLYGGAIGVMFVRAVLRRRLLRESARSRGVRQPATGEGWLRRALLALPRDIGDLRALGKSIAAAPENVRKRYQSVRMLGWIAIALVALLIVFSATAHRFCGS